MRYVLVSLALAALLRAATVVSGSVVLDPSDAPARSGDAASPLLPAPVELLSNNGFETGALPPWVTMPGNHWQVLPAPHSGVYSAGDSGNYWIRQDFGCAVPADSIQSITFWSRQPEVAIQAFDLMYSDSTYFEDIVWPTAVWQQWDVTSSLNLAKSLVGLRLWGYWGSSQIYDSTYIDDISVVGEPCPAVGEDEGGVVLRPLALRVVGGAGGLSFSLSSPARVAVYSASGARVGRWSETRSGRLSRLATGAYVVEARAGRRREVVRVVVR